MADYSDYSVDQYFVQRFSLSVLDTIRRLQDHRCFENGLETCHIVDYLRDRCFVDGDLESQVTIAIQDLESAGFVMRSSGGNSYRTLGPFAKLSLAKSQKQRRLIWKKLEKTLGLGVADVVPSAKRIRLTSNDCCNNQCG